MCFFFLSFFLLCGWLWMQDECRIQAVAASHWRCSEDSLAMQKLLDADSSLLFSHFHGLFLRFSSLSSQSDSIRAIENVSFLFRLLRWPPLFESISNQFDTCTKFGWKKKNWRDGYLYYSLPSAMFCNVKISLNVHSRCCAHFQNSIQLFFLISSNYFDDLNDFFLSVKRNLTGKKEMRFFNKQTKRKHLLLSPEIT